MNYRENVLLWSTYWCLKNTAITTNIPTQEFVVSRKIAVLYTYDAVLFTVFSSEVSAPFAAEEQPFALPVPAKIQTFENINLALKV